MTCLLADNAEFLLGSWSGAANSEVWVQLGCDNMRIECLSFCGAHSTSDPAVADIAALHVPNLPIWVENIQENEYHFVLDTNEMWRAGSGGGGVADSKWRNARAVWVLALSR